MNMKLLRIIIQQPNAHYRIPFTYQRRHTYPIPPYSTVFGFLINLLGIYHQESSDYSEIKKLKLSIAGRFEDKTTEMIWFRNISESAHKDRFIDIQNRKLSGNFEHFGGQSPMWIDVLNNVEIILHLFHENEYFLQKIYNNILNPQTRLEVLHLGRAEDWIIIKELPKFLDLNDLNYRRLDKNFGYFFWIPEKIYHYNSYSINFNDFEGIMYNLPVFSIIENYQESFNRGGKRIFQYIRTKLNEGKIINTMILIDKELMIPIFLGDFQ